MLQPWRLTGRFIELAGDVVGRLGGDGIGTRGDEVQFAFESPRQAIRAAVALQRALLDATREDPSLPMPAGIGLDVGEAVLVPDGWRANAINVAARLCSMAKGGEILATREVTHLAQAVEGIRYVPCPAARLKGIAEPVTPVRVVGEAGDAARGFAELGFTHAAVVPVHPRFRVVFADDHYLVREGVRRLLETEPEIDVVAVYADLDSLLEGVAAELPDVVLTDIRMPPTRLDEGIQAATRLRETHPDVGVVVLSQYAEPGYALALLEEGTARRGYLLKERVDDLAQLVGAIQQVAAGGSVIDPKVVESLVTRKALLDASPLNELTARERDVLREMAEGKNNAAIARGLFLAERSVENVIHSIFVKLGIGFEPSVHKRVKAVILYLAEAG